MLPDWARGRQIVSIYHPETEGSPEKVERGLCRAAGLGRCGAATHRGVVISSSEHATIHRLRQAVSTVTDEPIAGKNATANAASAAALLTIAIASKAISTIADDDDRFVAGIFAFVFSNYFALVLAGSFEEASPLAVIELLGIEEFHRCFDTIQESYNQTSQSRPKILDAIGKTCEAWFENPDALQFERLVELFKILRTHVVQK